MIKGQIINKFVFNKIEYLIDTSTYTDLPVFLPVFLDIHLLFVWGFFVLSSSSIKLNRSKRLTTIATVIGHSLNQM
jgi:hypothetical protein